MKNYSMILVLICSMGFVSCSKKDKTGNLTATLSTARTVAKGQAVGLHLNNDLDSPEKLMLADSNFFKTSFNPTSFKVTISGLIMCKEHMATDGSCPDTHNSIAMSSSNAIELAGQTALNPIATFSNSKIEKSDFGDYKSVSIGFQANVGAVLVSGSANVGDTPTDLTDQSVNSPTAVVSVNFPNTLTINENSTASFSILIDVESPVYLSKGAAAAGSTKISDDIAIQIPGWSILPYVGSGTPKIETYDVAFATDELGTREKYGLRITVLKDDKGAFYAASWTPVYDEGYSFGINVFQPQIIENLLTTANSDTYSLTTDPTKCTESTLNNVIACMKFPAFKLTTHEGKVTVGATEYSYTATKR